MNHSQYQYFVDLVNTKNFTETAEHFFTTQSNISKQIKSLETELNVILFDRSHRLISLTNAGEIFLSYALLVLAQEKELQSVLKPYQLSEANELCICAIPVMTTYNIPNLFATFQKKYPKIHLSIKEMETIQILSQLDSGLCDIAYHRIFNFDEKKYEKVTLAKDFFVAVLPIQHPLAKKEFLSLSNLKNEHFYQLDQSTQLMDQFYILCSESGFQPDLVYSGTRIDNILDFVSNQMGVSLLMKNSIPINTYPDICIRSLEHTIQSELVFIRKKDTTHSFTSNIFWNFIKKLVSTA